MVPAVLDRGADRCATFRLGGVDTGRRAIEQADPSQLLEGFGSLCEQGAGGDGNHEMVGCPPAELLHDLERQRLAAFRVKGAEVDVDDRPAVNVGELDAQPVDIVVGAVDLDDGRAVSAGGANFARLQAGRNEDQGAKSGARGVGRHRAGEVSGGGAGERVEAVGVREVGGDRDVAVLERPGWIQGVIFEIEMVETEHLAEVGRLDQGREPGPQVDRFAGGGRQQLAIAPDGVGALCNRLAADALAYGGEVVGDLERSEAVLADVGGFEVPQPSALPTSQLLHRIPPRRLVTDNKKAPAERGRSCCP